MRRQEVGGLSIQLCGKAEVAFSPIPSLSSRKTVFLTNLKVILWK